MLSTIRRFLATIVGSGGGEASGSRDRGILAQVASSVNAGPEVPAWFRGIRWRVTDGAKGTRVVFRVEDPSVADGRAGGEMLLWPRFADGCRMSRLGIQTRALQETVRMSAGITQAEPTTRPERPVFVERFPPLESGDRMGREEFHRRYETMPQIQRAELIEGVVYVPSPIRYKYHGRQHGYVLNWVGHYAAGTVGVDFGGNPSVFLDDINEPQPDGVLFIHPEFGGQVKIDERGYIVGAPDLAAEVAASSVSYDLHAKLNAYARNGVREYIVWRVYEQAIDWLVLRQGQYEPLPPAADGILRSSIFPGLRLDAAAMLRGDLAAVLEVVQQGLRSPEHAQFVAGLKQT
jgi:hypothetical protein